MSEKARFRYSAQDGTIELEGSEDFVSKHFEILTDMVRTISKHATLERKKETYSPVDSVEEKLTRGGKLYKRDTTVTLATYPDVFSKINEKLKIVADIPGNTKQEKMKNAALLYCYGSLLRGDEQVSSTEIREVCEEHGFLDRTNFSKIFDDKTLFITDGVKGGNKQVKLTFQGKKKAEALLNDLHED